MVNALFEQFQQMSSEDFEYIFKLLLNDVNTRILIAEFVDIPISILEFLVEHEKNELVLRGIARNIKTPDYLLEKLFFKHGKAFFKKRPYLQPFRSRKIYFALALNPNTPAHIRKVLLEDPSTNGYAKKYLKDRQNQP